MSLTPACEITTQCSEILLERSNDANNDLCPHELSTLFELETLR
jgi:hypothetical protein